MNKEEIDIVNEMLSRFNSEKLTSDYQFKKGFVENVDFKLVLEDVDNDLPF